MERGKVYTKEELSRKMRAIMVVFEGDDDDLTPPEHVSLVDLYAPVDFLDIKLVAKRIFDIVEQYSQHNESAWFFFLSNWDRAFVLDIYDKYKTTGLIHYSGNQASKMEIILRKMLTPPGQD